MLIISVNDLVWRRCLSFGQVPIDKVDLALKKCLRLLD